MQSFSAVTLSVGFWPVKLCFRNSQRFPDGRGMTCDWYRKLVSETEANIIGDLCIIDVSVSQYLCRGSDVSKLYHAVDWVIAYECKICRTF